MTKLAIGLCTYKRLQKLECCLRSLEAMLKPEGVRLSIIIADNDSAGSAGDTVERLEKELGIPIDYAIEPGRGIPFARNNVLRRAVANGVEWLAFIDDDEWVAPDWLVNYWHYMQANPADVYTGPVKTEYPDYTPSWIVKGGFWQRGASSESGLTNHIPATNNVVFNVPKLVIEWELYFDEAFGLKGGSDYAYFSIVSAKGGVIH